MIAAAAMVLGMTSCSDNEREFYDTNYSALNIWLGTETSVKDSVIYNYSYHIGEGTVPFQVRISGLPADHDRKFVLEAFDGDVKEAEGSFKIDTTYVLPAGAITASYNLIFNSKKLKNSESFKTTDGHLKLRIKETNDFSTGAGELSVLNIVLKNDISKPVTWDSPTAWAAYSTYFGAYSRAKYQFMIETLGYMDFTISWGSSMKYDEETNSISYQYATVLAQYLQQKLDEYNADHPDKPIVDESGTLVSFQ